MSRKTIDYYKDGQHILRIGKVKYEKAQKPLDTHIHENQIELTVIIKGSQIYQVDHMDYEIKSGEVFMTYPNEAHGSANNPEDKADFYYIIFNIEQLSDQGFLCEKDDAEFLKSFVLHETTHLIKGTKKTIEYCDRLMEACSENSPIKHTLIRNYLSLLVVDLFSLQKTEEKNEKNEMALTLEYIQQNIKEQITLSELADNYGVSLSRFKSLFRKEVGLPPMEYIQREKIKLAKKLLHDTNMDVTKIAMELGFSSGQYFATVFKRYVYLTPSEYRKKQK